MILALGIIMVFLLAIAFMCYRSMQKPKIISVSVLYTFIECRKCGKQTKRPFERGDYIFKEYTKKCAHCKKGKLYISGIYLERVDKLAS